MLDRTKQPKTELLEKVSIALPEREILPNGIPLSIIRSGNQEVIRLDIVFGSGRYQQQKPLQALLTNQMLKEGSSRFSSVEIAEKLDYYGAWLELASSSEHSFVVLYTLSKFFIHALELVEAIVKSPIFPEKELETILAINRQQFQINSEKVDYISQKFFNLAFFGSEHPSGNLISDDDYYRIDNTLLKEFHERHYNSNNCSLYLSGKVAMQHIAAVEEVFGKDTWGKTNTKQETTSPFTPQHLGKKLFISHKNAMQSSIRIGAPTLTRVHPDYMKFKMVTTLLGGYFGSRLMSNIREEKGYTYGIFSEVINYPDTSVLMISTEADNQYVDHIIKEVYHEIERLKSEPVSIEELEMVQNYLIGSMYRNNEGPFAMADTWISIDRDRLGDDYLTRSYDAIRSITPNEIMQLTSEYLLLESFIEVVAGKK